MAKKFGKYQVMYDCYQAYSERVATHLIAWNIPVKDNFQAVAKGKLDPNNIYMAFYHFVKEPLDILENNPWGFLLKYAAIMKDPNSKVNKAKDYIKHLKNPDNIPTEHAVVLMREYADLMQELFDKDGFAFLNGSLTSFFGKPYPEILRQLKKNILRVRESIDAWEAMHSDIEVVEEDTQSIATDDKQESTSSEKEELALQLAQVNLDLEQIVRRGGELKLAKMEMQQKLHQMQRQFYHEVGRVNELSNILSILSHAKRIPEHLLKNELLCELGMSSVQIAKLVKRNHYLPTRKKAINKLVKLVDAKLEQVKLAANQKEQRVFVIKENLAGFMKQIHQNQQQLNHLMQQKIDLVEQLAHIEAVANELNIAAKVAAEQKPEPVAVAESSAPDKAEEDEPKRSAWQKIVDFFKSIFNAIRNFFIKLGEKLRPKKANKEADGQAQNTVQQDIQEPVSIAVSATL